MTRSPQRRNKTVPPAHGGADAAADGQLSVPLLAEWRQAFAANPSWKLAMNAVTQTPVDDIALNRAVVAGTDFTFSHWLDDWTVTHQKQSGRCWMFAGLNLLRVGAMKKMRLKDFEFSQNYTLFWDKIERANYFLEKIIETAAQPVDDRAVAFLLSQPIGDGGQWNMFVNLIRKHGLVPKAMMPETESSSNTGRMNSILVHKLHEGAKLLREQQARGGAPAAIRGA
jgi:bleomycin hydrolase